MEKIYKTKSTKETKNLAVELISQIKRGGSKKAKVLALKGDLGGGKTTFVQGLAKALGIKRQVLSPTFNIFKRFDNFYHFDCYRINDSQELLGLGFKEIIADPKNIVAIEWAERIKNILPKDVVWISFKFINKTTREIVVKYPNVRRKEK